MKTSASTAPDLARSGIAVSPLARFPNLELNPAANRALIRHLLAHDRELSRAPATVSPA